MNAKTHHHGDVTASICIPTYNRPNLLENAITSVLEQTFDDVEVVVSDNHHTGEAIVADLGDPRIRYFANGANVGPARNFELALDRARGRFVGILSDDDRL